MTRDGAILALLADLHAQLEQVTAERDQLRAQVDGMLNPGTPPQQSGPDVTPPGR